MSPARTHTDTVIIGAGPIGIELAVALKQAGVDYVQLEAGSIGGTIGWWAPETTFFSSPERIEICGVPLVTPGQRKATREDYLAYLRGVVRQFGLAVRTGERVVIGRRTDDGFELTTRPSATAVGGAADIGPAASDAVSIIDARRVVLAIGDMHRPRRIGIPGEALPHVSHFFRDPHECAGQRVLIVGGKNSAVEAALRCYRVGARVTMSYRGTAFDRQRVKYWLHPEIEWLIDKGRIAFRPGTLPVRIGERDVTLAEIDDPGLESVVDADAVFLLTGYEQDQSLFDQLGVERKGDDRTPVFDKATMETNVPGVYLAGTAAAGSQRRTRLFIENTHIHVDRIARALTGHGVAWSTGDEYSSLAES